MKALLEFLLRLARLFGQPRPVPPKAPKAPPPPTRFESPRRPSRNRINEAGLGIIRRFESLHDGDGTTPYLEPVLCPAGVWTVGWGHALTDRIGQHIKGAPRREVAMAIWRERWPHGMTRADADALLDEDIARVERQLAAVLDVKVTENQWAALVSLAYNVGVGAPGGRFDLADSQLLQNLRRGEIAEAAGEFLDWNLVGGKPLDGLTRRRETERALFLTADP
jgi:lysozyme